MIFQKKCQFLRFSVKKGPTWEKGVVQKKIIEGREIVFSKGRDSLDPSSPSYAPLSFLERRVFWWTRQTLRICKVSVWIKL